MSDQNQILRLLGTIREESAAIRSRQEELFELLISYKDQIEDLKQTVNEKLSGLPKSPYIAGQLVPAPDTIDGTDDFRQLLATYLHGAPPSEEADSGPVDVEMPPPRVVDPNEVQLESEGRPSRSEGRSGGGGRGRGRGRSNSGGPRDSDLERGPDRDVEPFDLQEPEKGGGKKKAKRRRRRKKTASKGSSEAPAEAVADD